MSWRPTNSPRRQPASSPSRSTPVGPPLIDPTLQALIIATLVLGIVGFGLAVAFGRNPGQPSTTVANPQPVAATRPPAPTVAPAPTATAARPQPTAAPAVPISPAEAGPADTSGDAAAGAVLFASLPSEAIAVGGVTCSVCHNIAPGSGTLVGPSLSGIGATAATRQPDLSAAQYLRVSIINPTAYVVDGFAAGVMPGVYQQGLTPEQIEDLVAYLLTLP